MSNYNIKARHKKTGEIVKVTCMDNYFGPRVYGYIINRSMFDTKETERVLSGEEFSSEYEEIEND